tara:strand:+ start:11864 stop:13153 length:1290 start_codon:yes stop_codon:yes gene_type:complete
VKNLLDIYNLEVGKTFIEPITALSDLIGFLLIIFLYLIFFIIYKKNRSILLVITSAYFLRVFFILIGYYLVPLPDSLWDSRAIEYAALANTQLSFNELIEITKNAFLTSFFNFFALVYKVTGRSPLVLLALINFISVLTIINISKISFEVWSDRKTQLKCLIFLSIMPVNILYSSLILKESLIIFILSSSLLIFIKFVKTGNFIYGYLSIFLYLLNVPFHTPLIIGTLPIFIYFFYKSFFEIIKYLKKGYLSLAVILNTFTIIFIALSIFTLLFSAGKTHVTYIHFFDSDILQRLVIHARNTFTSSASYPSFLLPSNEIELIYLLPIKVFYFLFAPFPWDISKVIHLFGFIDSLFTMLIFGLIILNYKKVINNKYFFILFSIFFLILITYTLGTGNYGTAIRHKFKFLFIMIVFSSMFLPNIKIKFKND